MESGEHRPGNTLLRALDEITYRRVAARLRGVPLSARRVLHRANEPIEHVYFPETAVICVMSVMRDGGSMESATVGFEGVSWVSPPRRSAVSSCDMIVAVGGHATALPVADFERELADNERFATLLSRCSHALLLQSLRLTACTGLHSLDQRCARWFLTVLDRFPEDQLAITHEFLATLLGAVRPSVSAVIEEFQKRGILKLERGRVLIADRPRLLASSCECYEAIRRAYDDMPR
jgi:hypothetical protein